MAQFQEMDDLHPIDLVQSLAQSREWIFERTHDDQIAVVVEGCGNNMRSALFGPSPTKLYAWCAALNLHHLKTGSRRFMKP